MYINPSDSEYNLVTNTFEMSLVMLQNYLDN